MDRSNKLPIPDFHSPSLTQISYDSSSEEDDEISLQTQPSSPSPNREMESGWGIVEASMNSATAPSAASKPAESLVDSNNESCNHSGSYNAHAKRKHTSALLENMGRFVDEDSNGISPSNPKRQRRIRAEPKSTRSKTKKSIDDYVRDKEWKAVKVVDRRERGRRIEYCCEWEDSWLKSGTYKALKKYNGVGYKGKVIEAKMVGPVKYVKCKWEVTWEPEENIADDLIADYHTREQDSVQSRRSRTKTTRILDRTDPAVVEYNGTLMHINDIMAERDWPITRFLAERTTKSGKVEYLSGFKKTWETEEMVEALKHYGKGRKIEVTKTKILPSGQKMSLCRFPPEWMPRDNLTDSAKAKAVKDIARRKAAAASVCY